MRAKFQGPWKYYTPALLARFVFALLSFCERKCFVKYETWETGEIILECTTYKLISYIECKIILNSHEKNDMMWLTNNKDLLFW